MQPLAPQCAWGVTNHGHLSAGAGAFKPWLHVGHGALQSSSSARCLPCRDPNVIESAARDPRPTIAASKRRQLADQAARQQAEQERAARKQQQPQWELDQAAAAVYQKQSFDLR